MSRRFRGLLVLSFALCAMLPGPGGRANAASSAPQLSGVYAVTFHEFCQPNLQAQANPDPADNDNNAFVFNSLGSIKDKIGVLTFNSKTGTLSGSLIKVNGGAVSQDLTQIGGPVASRPFAESTKSITGTFSTTATTITVDIGDGPLTFDAVYGAFAGSIAHIVFLVNTSTDAQGDSCAQSGEFQFK